MEDNTAQDDWREHVAWQRAVEAGPIEPEPDDEGLTDEGLPIGMIRALQERNADAA